jgi:hypothetical protein
MYLKLNHVFHSEDGDVFDMKLVPNASQRKTLMQIYREEGSKKRYNKYAYDYREGGENGSRNKAQGETR